MALVVPISQGDYCHRYGYVFKTFWITLCSFFKYFMGLNPGIFHFQFLYVWLSQVILKHFQVDLCLILCLIIL